jgi:hypothetical protein
MSQQTPVANPKARSAPARRRRHQPRELSLSLTGVIIFSTTLLALFLRLYQLTRPGQFNGIPQYDDGVYLGAAVRLASGSIPYRDFVFVQPPGIVLLMLPLGVLAKAIGTASAMEVARILTACVSAAAVALIGRLVRHRGPLAAVLTCGILAVHPDSVNAASTLFLEPWLVLFCLLGMLAAFDGDQLANRDSRAGLCGLAIGLGGAVKAFAIFPALAMAALYVAARGWRRATRYVAGVAIGFLVVVLPFVALAPAGFFDGVIVSQYARTDITRVPGASRLSSLFGTPYLQLGLQRARLVDIGICAVVAVCVAVSSLVLRRRPPPLDAFALLTCVIALVGFLLPADFYPHYSALFAPFLALAVGLSVTRFVATVAERLPGLEPAAGRAVLLTMSVLAALAGVALMAGKDFHFERLMFATTPSAQVDREIPKGACVLTDEASFTIMTNRFASNVAGCSPLVDSLGTDLGLGRGHNGLNGAGRYPAVDAAWMAAFRRAQYVWLSCSPPGGAGCDASANRRIPWTPQLRAYFAGHFQRIARSNIYERDGTHRES